MKTKYGLVLGCAIALSACTSMEERRRASGGFKYMEAEPAKMIEIPSDLDAPVFAREFELPEVGDNAPTSLLGKNIEVVSPALVLPLVSGSYVEEGKKSATVKFDQVDDRKALDQTIWNTLLSFLEQNGIGVESYSPEEGTLFTDWMLIEQEVDSSWYSWNTTESQTGRRFEFSLEMAPHGRTASLNVTLKDYLKTIDDDVVSSIDDVQTRPEEVDILNQVISHYDYQLGLEMSRRIAKIKSGLTTELGFDADGSPAFVVDSTYDIVWNRIQLVLKFLGFDVKDLDSSTGLLFVTYNGTGGGWWSDLFSGDEDLLELGDYRLKLSRLGDKTSVTFMNSESEPFEVNQITGLYDIFSEVMLDDDLDF